MNARLLASWIVSIAVAVALAVAALWSARAAWADHWLRQETIPATEKAIAVTPLQADYYTRLGMLEASGDSGDAGAAFARAVELDPADARSWVELGLSQETHGQLPAAERSLLRAAAESREYLPRWTLLNFYIRRNDPVRALEWARSAAAVLPIYGDPTGLFRLCAAAGIEGDLVERLEIRRPDVRAAWLGFVAGGRYPAVILTAAQHVFETGSAADKPALLSACDRLLDLDAASAALDVWNRLADSRSIPFPRVTPGTVVNPDFAAQPSGHGFDWRLTDSIGVNVSMEENPSGIRVAFSGEEGEHAESLAEWIAVAPATACALRCRYRTSGIAAGTGLHWQVADAKGAVLASGPHLSSDEESESQLRFVTPPGCHAVRLSLRYDRAPGTTRVEGYVLLRNVSLI
jgi:tetratricopeptide (TPR) repeat protein